MSVLVIYLTHHNNVQLRVFPAQFRRKFNNASYPNLNFLTALYKDQAITRQDDDIGFTDLCSESSSSQSIADFFDCISQVKQKNNVENVILCIEANLGVPAANTTNPAVSECVRLAGASHVTFFSATPACLEAAKMEYSNSANMLFEPHGFYSIDSHLDLIKNSKSGLRSASDLSNLEFASVGTPNDENDFDQYVYFGSQEQLGLLSASNQKVSDGFNDSSVSLLNEVREYSQFFILDKEEDNNRSNHAMDVRAAAHNVPNDADEVRLSRTSLSELLATSSNKPSVLQDNALFPAPRSEKMAHHTASTDEAINDRKSLNRASCTYCCCCFFPPTKVHVDMLKSSQSMSAGFSPSPKNQGM